MCYGHGTMTSSSPALHFVDAREVRWRGLGTFDSLARLEVYADEGGRRAVVVLIDGDFNSGTSTINDAEGLAGLVFREILPDVVPDAVVRFLDCQTMTAPGEETPRYTWVRFVDVVRQLGPSWSYASRAEVEDLIGQSAWRSHSPAFVKHGFV